MLKYFTKSISDRDFTKTIQRKGDTHVVCIAVNGLTFFNGLAIEAFEKEHRNYVSFEEGTWLCIDANQNNEVRTLFPKINVSVLPLSIYEDRNSWEDYEKMKTAILKIFEIDQEYLKSRRIVFALEERADFNITLAYSVLEELLTDKNLYSITCSVYVL